jgi:ubiquinone/menaquinone biosynthesis C-methylase UbiE
VSTDDADTQRAELLERWERNAAGWGTRAEAIRAMGMPVSVWMVDSLALHPGQKVLELAAGPGDTGFLAAELIEPGGVLICSDAAEGMLAVARARAAALGAGNVEFIRLELEWIDLPTASVDALLCRWGLMFALDPAAALSEFRRVLRPGGRLALAAWDAAEQNPWATMPTRALMQHGHVEPPDSTAPGPFVLSAPGRLRELIEAAGFTEVVVETVEIARSGITVEEYIAQTLDISGPFAQAHARLSEAERAELHQTIAGLAAPFTDEQGLLELPGRTFVAAASA